MATGVGAGSRVSICAETQEAHLRPRCPAKSEGIFEFARASLGRYSSMRCGRHCRTMSSNG